MGNIKYYDLTAVFSDALPIYGGKNGGDPCVVIEAHSSIANGGRSNVSKISFGNHTGTHADVPKHFIDDGRTNETMPPEYFFGVARVLDLRKIINGRKLVEPADLEAFNIQEGEIILLNTGNTPLMFETEFTKDYVSLSVEAAAFLVNKKIRTIGIDYLSIEATGSGTNPVHKKLLGNNIGVLEGLVFDGFVPQGTFLLSALPLKFKDGNGSPVRAVLMDDFSLELVIFDMDGLMLDTEPSSKAGWNEACRQMGYEMTEGLYRNMIGTNYQVCEERMKACLGENFNFDEAHAIRTEFVTRYREIHGVGIKKGLLFLLDTLDQLKIKKCVATSTTQKRAHEVLKTAGIIDRFNAVIGGDMIPNGKPAPDIFLAAASECVVNPEDCIVLEDSETGIEAAYRAGMRSIMVPDMYEPDNPTRAKVTAVCVDLDEVAERIGLLKETVAG
jgi:HAD superfamily hydrolase (TIGR01509 family)